MTNQSGADQSPKSNHRWVSAEKLATFMKVSKNTVYRMLKKGEFDGMSKKIGQQWRIDLDAYLEA